MSRKTKRDSRSGAVVVEFALTAPLLFAMLFAALELGHANMVFNVAEAAAYEGAREGIVPGASVREVIDAAQNMLDISRVRAAQIQVTPNTLTRDTETIEVSISIPYDSNTLMPPFFMQGVVINRVCELTREDVN